MSPVPLLLDADRIQLQRRTLRVLRVSQLFGGAGSATGIAVVGILAHNLLHQDTFAGFPGGLYTLGAALSSAILGRWMARVGRRPGLLTGYGVGAIGAVAAVAATLEQNVLVLMFGMVLFGAGSSANLMSRYTGADLAGPGERAKAISTVVFATTLGSVLGPDLAGPLGLGAERLSLPALAGPFLFAGICFVLAASTLAIFLRPDPLVVSGGTDRTTRFEGTPLQLLVLILRSPGARLGLLAMALSQALMNGIMVMTPVYMTESGFTLTVVGVVISLHILGMYGPSPITGRLADRFGRPPLIVAGGVVMAVSALIGVLAPSHSAPLIAAGLLLLGVGWNFGLIAGSAQLTESVDPAHRAEVQGLSDLGMGLSGAVAGAMAGVVMQSGGFHTLSLIAAAGSAMLLALGLWPGHRRAAAGSA